MDDPPASLGSLKIMGTAVRMLCTHPRRLLPVLVGIFMLNVALTALLVNLASPPFNLDSMGMFYEIDNSTAPASDAAFVVAAAADEDEDTVSKFQFLGRLFWRLSLIATVFCFSKAFPPEGTRNLRQQRRIMGIFPLPMIWREVQGVAHVAAIVEIAAIFTFTLLDEEDLEDHFRKLMDFIASVYLVAVVVVSSEGIYSLHAIQRAWELVGRRFKDITVFSFMFVLMLEALDSAYMMAFSQEEKKDGGPFVIREDTSAEIFKFSLVSAFVAVIAQSFLCAVIVTFYNQDRNGQHRRRNAVVNEVKKIERLTRVFVMHGASDDTMKLFKRELFKHTSRTLAYMGETR
ncbi:hypothetical protein BAE44_0018889 [Dichanthelium oligosanthes]|uniref:Uncharacterized protein n=1 Tax=Dichanthelium oligosanthes TaxID=888268 RepID=A0A1E5V4K8_9POAL|nr:hypothetical protein BAE44_0018889 [Dichanthelium oligosanthes]